MIARIAMQKTFLIPALIFIAFFSVTAVWADSETDVAAIQAAWVQEPPLDQTDIDNYILVWPRLMDFAQKDLIKEDFRPFFQEVGWNDVHGSYVLTKMNLALILLEAPELEAKLKLSMPDNALPSAAESELVKHNYDRINRMQADYIDRQTTTKP